MIWARITPTNIQLDGINEGLEIILIAVFLIGLLYGLFNRR